MTSLRPCFTDNGHIGGSITATGRPHPATLMDYDDGFNADFTTTTAGFHCAWGMAFSVVYFADAAVNPGPVREEIEIEMEPEPFVNEPL